MTQRATTPWRDPWICAAFAVAALYALEMATQAGGASFVQRFAVLADLPTGAGAFLASAWAAQRSDVHSAMRRAWTLLACAQLAFVLGSTSWAYLQEVLHAQPFPSPADAFYIAFYMLAFAALVVFSTTVSMRSGRAEFALDGAIFVAAAGALVWALVIVPFMERSSADVSGANFLKGTMSIAYACGSGLLLFGIGALLVRGGAAGRRPSLVLLAIALTSLFMADVTWLSAELGNQFKPGGLADALYVISQAFQIAAARTHGSHPSSLRASVSIERRQRQPSTGLVSLFTMLATGAVVLWLRRDHIDRDEGVVLVAMIVAAALAGLRQTVSAREVARMLAHGVQKKTERRFAAIFEQSSDVIAVTDERGHIQYITPSVARVLGYAPDAVEQVRLVEFVHPEEKPASVEFFRDVLGERGVTAPREWRVRRRDGDYRCLESVATNLLHDPVIGGIVITMRDVTERRVLQDRLSDLAFKDSLTLLSNRSRFRDAVARSLEKPDLGSAPFAILFVDLDDFKRVNDSLGHHKGDELLRIVAGRMQDAVPEDAEVARLGGDEFAVLLRDCASAAARTVADALIDALATPMRVGGSTLTIGASVGIAVATAGNSADDVLRHADIAMYEAKRQGKGRAESFELPMQVRASQRLDLEERLREAIAMARIELHYQPVIDMRNGAMIGVEALARWDDALHGSIPAGEFVALAEDSGQINALGRLVLFEACRQVGAWRAQDPKLATFTVAVNVSARQLDDDHFSQQVEQALHEGGLPADGLVLELTESAMLHPHPQLRAVLDRLHRSGVRLALDDFGAGYSSLSYLHRFPFDVLKIDRALVERVGYSDDGSALVRAVLSVAEAMDLSVIAEGVENRIQQDELLRIGCHLGQGYLLARPMPATQFLEWFARGSPASIPLNRQDANQ